MTNFNADNFVYKNYPKKNLLIEKILYKIFALKSKFKDHALGSINNYDQRIMERLKFFDLKAGEGKGRYERRFKEMLDTLELIQPKNIREMGSGRSSLIFAAWAQKNNIDYKAFEQLDFWVGISNEAVNVFGELSPIEHCEVMNVDKIGGRFKRDIELDADFIFVDAPTIPKSDDFITYTKKAAFTDVPDLIRRGGKPRVIMVDSRTASVDIILSALEDSGLEFDFKPGFMWAMQRHYYKEALACRLHSYFFIK